MSLGCWILAVADALGLFCTYNKMYGWPAASIFAMWQANAMCVSSRGKHSSKKRKRKRISTVRQEQEISFKTWNAPSTIVGFGAVPCDAKILQTFSDRQPSN